MTRSETLLLPVSPGEVRAACRSAVLSEIWELEQETADRLVAHEWQWRVSCQVRPARIEISIDSAGPHGTKVRLEASTAGIGPVPARHLRNHLASLIAAVRRGIEYPLPGPDAGHADKSGGELRVVATDMVVVGLGRIGEPLRTARRHARSRRALRRGRRRSSRRISRLRFGPARR